MALSKRIEILPPCMVKSLYYTPRRPETASARDVERLRRIFRDDVRQVSALIGRDLGHWLVEPRGQAAVSAAG